MTARRICACALMAFAACGCAGYRWTSGVPEEYRTVSVPVFENRTMAAELGPTVTQYVRREFQREGTFSLRRTGDAAVEVQGAIASISRAAISYDRSFGMRAREYRYLVTAEVTFIDKKTGRVMADNRKYVAETTFMVQGDILTGQRNAAARVAQDIARQIVDDAAVMPYGAEPSGK